jgi:hypothetical protein
MTMKTRWLVLGLALCLVAAPARADLFGFTISNPLTTFDGVNFFQSANLNDTLGHLYRNGPLSGSALLGDPVGDWGGGAASFQLSMTISDITASSAHGDGTFTFADVDGDVVSGNVSGTWTPSNGTAAFFNGNFSNVTFTTGDDTFDGDVGSVNMIFASSQPWGGGMTEITEVGTWFTPRTPYEVQGGSIDALVTPAPAALLLGLLGMSVAGLKLRKFA